MPDDSDSDSKPFMVREAAVQWGTRPQENRIGAGEFKIQCLRLIDRVAGEGTEFVVTRYGRPVAKLVPYDAEPSSVFGHVAGSVLRYGDLISPVGDAWDADA
jgi:antitoxin (DNA-binding transcriptional repressor) of toxin-antitoxin stability system